MRLNDKRLPIRKSLFPIFYIMFKIFDLVILDRREGIQYWIPSLRSRKTKLPIDYYQ